MDILQIFHEILKIVHIRKYSDIHLCVGSYPIIRNNSGEIIEVKQIKNNEEILDIGVIKIEQIQEILKYILSERKYQEYNNSFESDSSYKDETHGTRYRVNCYKDTKGDCIAMRRIPEEIPSLSELGLGENIKNLCSKSKGLILMTGPTGSGKSTNISSMIEYINTNFKRHIITIEDPVEFVYQNKLSLVNQREIGIHTKDFPSAMKACLREDPDIIMVGEMRDPETIKAAITLAETGHLVFSTLHTNDTVQSIDRMVDVFPAAQQSQIRMQLAMSLIGVVAQRLIPKKEEEGRVPVREVLLNNDAIRNLIINGKTHQIYSVIEVGQKQGMILMDNYLVALYKKGIISKETLLSYVRDKDNIDNLL